MENFISCVIFLCLASAITPTSCFKPSRRVHIAGLLPFDDARLFSVNKVRPAVDIAVDKIKSWHVPFKHFSINYGNTKCAIANGMDEAITFFVNEEVDVFLGPACDYSAAPVARQLIYWNVPMITAGAMAADFFRNKKTEFQLMTRVGPNINTLVTFFLSVLKRFQWRRVKMLYNPDGQAYVVERFCHITMNGIDQGLRLQRQLNVRREFFKFDTLDEMINNMAKEMGNEIGGMCCPVSGWGCLFFCCCCCCCCCFFVFVFVCVCVCVFVCFFPGNYRFVTRQYEIGGKCCPVSGWGCCFVVVGVFFLFFFFVCVCVLCVLFSQVIIDLWPASTKWVGCVT